MATCRADGFSAVLPVTLGATLGVIRLLRAELTPQCGHITLPSAILCVAGGDIAEPSLELMLVLAGELVNDHDSHIMS